MTSSAVGGDFISPTLQMLAAQYPSVFHLGESQYISTVGLPKTAAKWVSPVSTPTVRSAPAITENASSIEKAGGTKAPGIWLANSWLILFSEAFPHGKTI